MEIIFCVGKKKKKSIGREAGSYKILSFLQL